MEYEKYKAWIKSASARVAYAPTLHFLSPLALLKFYDNLMGLEPIWAHLHAWQHACSAAENTAEDVRLSWKTKGRFWKEQVCFGVLFCFVTH